jgi:hypothetical protein
MRSRITGVLLGALVVAVSASPAEAQLGGLLKNKAKEAVQSPAKKDEAKPRSDAAAAALSAPNVVPITQDVIDRFKTGLNVEIKLRGEFRTFLASLKTPQQLQQCKLEVMMSPEGQKISMQMANLADNTPPAELQKVMMKAGTEIEALTTKVCGTDPTEWNDTKRADRLRDIEGQASDAAAPPGFVAPGRDTPALPVDASRDDAEGRGGPSMPEKGSVLEHVAGAQGMPHPYLLAYALLKERIPPFCVVFASVMKEGDVTYHYIPGLGKGVWVYSNDEARVLAKNCQTIMELLTTVTEVIRVNWGRLP